MSSGAPTVVSLYCGAGGLDWGFIEAGFDIRCAIDSDPWAVESYSRNIGAHAIVGELPAALDDLDEQPDLVIGGPPCQGFSVIGRMDPSDPRSRHVFAFLDAVERLEPCAFVMENVKALAASPRWSPIREALLTRASGLGYEVALFVLNAADFGVPQARERMFLVGLRGNRPSQPTPTTSGEPLTAGEVLRALPPFGSPGNDARCNARVIPAARPVMRPTARRGSLLFNGSGRPLDLDGPAKTLPASMGGNATPIVDQLELESRAKPWVEDYHARLLAGEPPLRVAPDRMRRLTVQEAAALQTFPREWSLAGAQVNQYRQIGNAVPPRLAHAVASAVRSSLTDALASRAHALTG